MTAEQFVYWLQGFMEINDPDTISKSETRVIKDHLALVFKKETPNRNGTITVPNTPYVGKPDPEWLHKNTVYCSTDTGTSNIIC
jgi:hypothetical protein